MSEAESTVKRYLREYDRRVGLETAPTSENLDSNFSPTYKENIFESCRLYLESGKDDGIREAILNIGNDNADPLEKYLK